MGGGDGGDREGPSEINTDISPIELTSPLKYNIIFDHIGVVI